VFLTSRQKGERQIEGTPFYITSRLPDWHLTRPGSNCIPLTGNGLAAPQRHLGEAESSNGGTEGNLSIPARSYLARLDGDNPIIDPQSADLIWMRALAIGYSRAYLSENADGIRQDWPRIPLPDNEEALLASAALGRQIAALLDTETPFVTPASSRHPDNAGKMPALREIAAFALPPGTEMDEAKHFAVTAGWGHAGQGGVTMPGKGKIVARDYTEKERVSLGEAINLLGDRTCDVYLNDFAYWSNIPLRVWEYSIGGYQVIKKWLSYREEKLLGRPLTKEEVRYVQEMCRRIAAILLLEPALDANHRKVMAHTFRWKGLSSHGHPEVAD
jgi:hypothetical protein